MEDFIHCPKEPGRPRTQKIHRSQRNAEHHPLTKKPQRWNEQLKFVRLQKQLSPLGPQWRENPATIGQSLKQRAEYGGTFVEMNCLNSAVRQCH